MTVTVAAFAFFDIGGSERGQKACLCSFALEKDKAGGTRIRAGRTHARKFVNFAECFDGHALRKPCGMRTGREIAGRGHRWRFCSDGRWCLKLRSFFLSSVSSLLGIIK